MQKKSHKRKFQVGQLVKVLGSVDSGYHDYFAYACESSYITEYERHPRRNQNYKVNGWWYKASELEAIETPEEFFTEKETDGPIAQVLLKVLERMQINEEYNYSSDPKKYSSYYTCDLIGNISGGGSKLQDDVLDFLDTFGFESKGNGFHKFSEFNEGFERQSARFNWILFALQIAREQGV